MQIDMKKTHNISKIKRKKIHCLKFKNNICAKCENAGTK